MSLLSSQTFGPSAVVYPTFSAPPVAASHLIAAYYSLGTLSGAPAIDPSLQVRGLTFAINTATAGEVRLDVTGTATPSSLTWSGDGVGNAWNLNSTANWGADTFFQYDNVTFDDSGNNDTNIDIAGILTPGALTVSGTKSYTFSGSGSLAGFAPLTKSTTGDLTILNENQFGTINISAGKLLVGNGGTNGSIGGTAAVTLAAGTTLEFNHSNGQTFSRAFTAGELSSVARITPRNSARPFNLPISE